MTFTINILTSLITHFVLLSLGFYLGLKYVLYKQQQTHKKQLQEIENQFNVILDNKQEIKFKYRIHNFVHFKYKKLLLIYNMEKHDLSIFQKEECLYTSTTIKSEIPDKLINYLLSNFDKEINDVTLINGYYITNSYLKKKQKNNNELEKIKLANKKRHNLDEILDKINKEGLNSLTETERQFLEKYK